MGSGKGEPKSDRLLTLDSHPTSIDILVKGMLINILQASHIKVIITVHG